MQQLVTPNLGAVAGAGLCLAFAQSVLGAPVKYDSATQAWQNQQGRHPGELPPSGVTVPIWFSHYGTYGPMGNTPRHYGDWGHVAVRLADGSIISSPGSGVGRARFSSIGEVERYFNAKYVGWSEYMNGRQIVAITPASKGDVVKRNHTDDTKSKTSGREIKPGAYIYLAEWSNPGVSDYKNVTPQGPGNYSITPSIRVDGDPGDEVEVVFVSIKGTAQSTHFPETVVIGPRGVVIRTVNFDWQLAAGWEGAIRVTALKTNKKPVTVRRLYCTTSLYA